MKILILRGEQHPASKLRAVQVSAIRRRALAGEPHRAIADDFGIATAYVSQIKRGERWRHIA